MARISNMTIDGRVLSRLVIDGKEVSFVREPVTPDCLCFTAQQANSTVKMVANGSSAPVVNLQISMDGISWTPYVIGADILLQNVDDKVYWKAVGSNSVMGKSSSNYNKFVMTGKIGASGNINSLLEENEETARTMSLAGKSYCYFKLFFGCKSLVNAPELPTTTLADYCYVSMFNGCTSLINAPELPATTLASSCYQTMFFDCTSLINAPELPATTLASRCYNQMFNGCRSLANAPELPATTLIEYCYYNMFLNCTSLNKLRVSFTKWNPTNATTKWIPNNTGTFECPQELINNTTSRTESTVPSNWTMTPTQS